jgi:hypothetical protein
VAVPHSSDKTLAIPEVKVAVKNYGVMKPAKKNSSEYDIRSSIAGEKMKVSG